MAPITETLDLFPSWEFVADTVMGGVSSGQLHGGLRDGRNAHWLTGDVSLDNNGGFIQMAADFAPDRGVDAGAWLGFTVDVQGNGESYEMRLKTDQLTKVWQSFRTSFTAQTSWHRLILPFADFEPYRTEASFDPGALTRIGILAVGRAFQADVAVAKLCLYR